MLNDFTAEYSQRSDDELLLLASDRADLTTEAAAALDAELRRRNLRESDKLKFQKFIQRTERREAGKRRKKIFGTRARLRSWVDLLLGLLIIVLISFTYQVLPGEYHMRADWQEAAEQVMFASVFIVVFGRSLWRKIGFWISLIFSSALHVVVVHAWVQRAGKFSRDQGNLAILLGFVLFGIVYGLVWVLRRNFYGEESHEHA
jgi:hypothetical protein